jgi:hypothetical protein
MQPPREKHAGSQIAELLADLFGCPPAAVRVTHVGDAERYDYEIVGFGRRFVAKYKSSGSTGPVSAAIDSLKRFRADNPRAGLPLIVVPFMGPVGKQLCDRSGISWLDLCGNAKIIAPRLRIWVDGRPNKYRDRGRPASVFAPKSSRVVRQLLHYPRRFQTQAELARQTELGDGYVSRIVRRLDQEHYIRVNKQGAICPRDPEILLDAWRDVYDFNRHRIIKGHVAARSGEELVGRVVQGLVSEKLDFAATGLCAAWLYTRFAGFRLATVYLSSVPSRSLLNRIGFSDDPRGANLWLVLPNDEGVFHGGQAHAGIPCVSAVQTYLDLKNQPERAQDAAAEIRRQFLVWGPHAT